MLNSSPAEAAAQIIVLLFSVIVHEVMHGWVALKFGDHTAERAGRLTLNPLPHVDPIGTLLVPLVTLILAPGFMFGWAKPVPVNPLNFSEVKKGELFVSLAGIVSNFTLAIIGAILFRLTSGLGIDLLNSTLVGLVYINLILGAFNLLPIPPLDGSKALISYLPYKYAVQLEQFSMYGQIILMVLLFSGVIGFFQSMILIPLARLLLG